MTVMTLLDPAPVDAAQASPGEPLVRLSTLSKNYASTQAVQNLSLDILPGEVFALLGLNGAGKTTTIRMIMGILQPSGGTARVHGLDCFAQRVEVKRLVGYLPDEPTFYDHLRGRELIQFAAEMHGLDGHQAVQDALPLAQKWDLENALEDFAVNYSRGMKKKLALLCALVHDPALLILDEPTSGLDPAATRELLELMQGWAQKGKSIFFSTHVLEHAERVAHRIGIVHQGRLADVGTLDELRHHSGQTGSLEDIFLAITQVRGAHP